MVVISRRRPRRGASDTRRPVARRPLGTRHHEPANAPVLDPGLREQAALAVVDALGPLEGLRLIDVAAGDGRLALAAARAGAEVVAIASTPEEAALGHAHATAEGLRVEWRIGSPGLLPAGDGCAHAVASLFGVTHAQDALGAAAEMVRVLRPGGCLAVATEPRHRWSRLETGLLLFVGFEGLDVRRHDRFAVVGGRRP